MEIIGLLFLAAALFLIIFPIIALVKLSKISNHVSEIEYKLNLLRADLLEKKPSDKAAVESEKAPEITVEAPIVTPLEPEPEPEQPQIMQAEESPVTPKTPPAAAQTFTAPQPGRLEKLLDAQSEKINAKLANFEDRSAELFKKILNWICVGEEYRTPGVSREYAVATTWLIRLGVIILLCGIGFFLKYSIDRNWTPPPVRVIFMTIAGLAMAGIGSWKSRGKYRPLAIALAGAGLVTLYLSIMTAYKLYNLIEAPYAFGFMIVVTIAAMASAVNTNALLTALLGCAGGYLTPIFINTGSQNITGLFIYMSILCAGTLGTAFYRNWPLLNGTSFLFYAVIGGAAVNHLPQQHALAVIGLLAVNYLIFGGQQFISALKKDMTLWETLLFCGNTGFFLTAALGLSQRYYAHWELPAIVSIFAAAAALTQMIYLIKKVHPFPKVLMVFLQIQLGLALTLTVPLLLGNLWITAAWAVMALGFTQAAIKLKSRTLLIISMLLYLITPLREIADPAAFGSSAATYLDQLLKHLLTAGVYIASLTASGILLLRYPLKSEAGETLHIGTAGKVFLWTAGILFGIYTSFELHWAFAHFLALFQYGVLVLYWSLAALLIMYLLRKYEQPKLCMLPILLLVLAGAWFLAWGEPDSLRKAGDFWKSFLYTFLTAGLYIAALAITARQFMKSACDFPEDQPLFTNLGKIFYTASGILFFLYSSNELYDFWIYYLADFRNGGLSVYWSALAVVLLVWGLKKDCKALRMCGIGLFAAVALKIFFIDLAQLEQLWRIVAFAVIGIVMLAGAVFYIRCKDMFVKKESGDQ